MHISHTFILFVGALIQLCGGSRILVIVAIASKSHTSMFNPLIKELAGRGHEIVTVTVRKLDKPVPGVTEYEVDDAERLLEGFVQNTYENQNFQDPFNDIRLSFTNLLLPFCEITLQNPDVQKLIKSDESFDLILIDATCSECLLGFTHKFQAPYIAFGLPGALTWNNDAVGNSNNYAYIPNAFSLYTDRMTFLERVTNLFESERLTMIRNYYYLPRVDKMMRQHFGDDMPPLWEMERNASMLFVNAHFSMNPPKPNLPAAIEVGALHCHPPKPLAKELEDFVSESGDAGFIYFSMGTAVKSSLMPEHQKNIFLKVFSKLKQRVVWKWEKDMPDKPTNVLTSKWLQQQDLLGHPKIRLFISHGGLFGTQEATYHGVPMVMIPMIADQFVNSKRVEAAGYARLLNFFTLTEESLLQTIEEVLNNNTYQENAAQKSMLLKDQPETPLERAVFWTEYVIRHRGARHMRSAVLDLTWYQRAMWDVVLVFVLAIIVTSFVLCKTLKWVVTAVKGKKTKQE